MFLLAFLLGSWLIAAYVVVSATLDGYRAEQRGTKPAMQRLAYFLDVTIATLVIGLMLPVSATMPIGILFASVPLILSRPVCVWIGRRLARRARAGKPITRVALLTWSLISAAIFLIVWVWDWQRSEDRMLSTAMTWVSAAGRLESIGAVNTTRFHGLQSGSEIDPETKLPHYRARHAFYVLPDNTQVLIFGRADVQTWDEIPDDQFTVRGMQVGQRFLGAWNKFDHDPGRDATQLDLSSHRLTPVLLLMGIAASALFAGWQGMRLVFKSEARRVE